MKLFNTGAVEDVKIGFFVLQAVLNIEFLFEFCGHRNLARDVEVFFSNFSERFSRPEAWYTNLELNASGQGLLQEFACREGNHRHNCNNSPTVTAEVDDQVAADSCFSNKFRLIVHGTTTR